MTPQLLAESALRAGVLGMAAWALLRLLRVRSPGHERIVWLCVLLASAGMPLVLPLANTAVPGTSTVLRLPGVAGGGAVSLLFPLYLAVSAVLLARLALGTLTLARTWRAATPLARLSMDGVPVRSSRDVRVPVVVAGGVLLPADWDRWSPQALARVLAHERSHVRRGDFYWQLLACVYRAAFWISPLGWWLERRLALLAEHLSDDAALAQHRDRPAYAELLLAFSGGVRQPLLAVGMARRTSLAARIERILDRPDIAPARVSGAFVGAALCVAVAASATVPWLAVGEPSLGRLPPLDGRLEGSFGRLPPLGPLTTP